MAHDGFLPPCAPPGQGRLLALARLIVQLDRLIPQLARRVTQLAAIGVALLIYTISVLAASSVLVALGIHSDIGFYLIVAFLVGGPVVSVVVGWRIWRHGKPPVPKEPLPLGWGQKPDEE